MGTIKHDSGRNEVFFIAGGGTGGHVFPALAVGHALKAQRPDAQIIFIGTAQGLEVRAVPAAGFRLLTLPGGKLNFQGRLFDKLKTLIKLPAAAVLSLYFLIKYRPRAVLGVGGYASGPLVLVASLFGVPSAIWEPNATPGLTNRILSRFVRRCFTVFNESASHLKGTIQNLGMPVRQEVELARQHNLHAQNADSSEAGRPFRILCTGGSQGARAVNEALFAVLKDWTLDQDGAIEVVHQIGRTDWHKFKALYALGFPNVTATEFIEDMPKQMQWADLVIARAGASTVAEISAFGRAAIFIPLPGAEAHQEKNAASLASAGAAYMLPQRDLSPERLKSEIKLLMQDTARLKAYRERIVKFFEPRATERIAKAILELAGVSKSVGLS